MSNQRKGNILQMLQETPDDGFLRYALALEEHKEGNLVAAIQLLEQLMASDPEYLGTYYQLGKFYEEANEAAKAIGVYKRGLIQAKQIRAFKIENELKEALNNLIDED